MVTISRGLAEACAHLSGESARLEAEALLAHVLGKSRAWLYAHAEQPIDDDARKRFSALIQLRQHGQPVAYLVGRREFWSLDLAVNADTLIPRPETERLVELALQRMPVQSTQRVLDLGTGSGAIALAIASERTSACITAVDADAGALAVARANAANAGMERVRFLHSDWFSALPGERFDLLLSNPPYIAEDDPHLQHGDLRFEPRSALASGADGLNALRAIIDQASGHLLPGGCLLVEHGWQQAASVRSLFTGAGFAEVETMRDLEDRERVTGGRMSGGTSIPRP